MSRTDRDQLNHEKLFWQCDACGARTNDASLTDIALFYKIVGKGAIAHKPVEMTIRLGGQVYISPHTVVESASRFSSVFHVCLCNTYTCFKRFVCVCVCMYVF